MFRNKDNIYKYRPAWRAREAEILALAMTGYEKKMRARRFETLLDTTLWKVHKPKEEDTSDKSTRVLQSTEPRMLQIEIQRWIRAVIRYYREHAPVESPCNYGSAERIIHPILTFLGCPLWHDDQMHLSEWQALQQIEYLFNLTLTVDAKTLLLRN